MARIRYLLLEINKKVELRDNKTNTNKRLLVGLRALVAVQPKSQKSGLILTLQCWCLSHITFVSFSSHEASIETISIMKYFLDKYRTEEEEIIL